MLIFTTIYDVEGANNNWEFPSVSSETVTGDTSQQRSTRAKARPGVELSHWIPQPVHLKGTSFNFLDVLFPRRTSPNTKQGQASAEGPFCWSGRALTDL